MGRLLTSLTLPVYVHAFDLGIMDYMMLLSLFELVIGMFTLTPFEVFSFIVKGFNCFECDLYRNIYWLQDCLIFLVNLSLLGKKLLNASTWPRMVYMPFS